jgi:Protein of unknown function (DUF935)
VEADPGYGPPPGNPTGPGRGGGVPFDELARANRLVQPFTDAASNALLQGSVDATSDLTASKARTVYGDIPLVTIQNSWSVGEARGALFSHLIGIFYQSGMLCESILGDDRVTACLNSKATALFGREVIHSPATGRAKGSAAGKECAGAWAEWWPMMSGAPAFRMMQDYSCLMGFAHSQIWWPSVPGLQFAPLLRPWFPQYEYYEWMSRRYMALGSNAVIPIVPGNGKWVEHAPHGSYRGWIRGAIRPVCEPWMLRHFGFRDMARFGEVHGNPTRVGYVPAVADPVERSNFETSLSNLGADAAMIVPRGVDGQENNGYGYELVEAQSKAWQVHPTQIDRCDMAIVLAILMQNLTTEVDGGSYGAAKVHMDVRQGGTQFDNQSWKHTIYTQIARPFAFLNFGDADLAPWTSWDVVGSDEYEHNADQWDKAATGMNQFAQAGMRFTDADEVREWMSSTMGLKKFPKFTLTEPKVAGGAFGGDDSGSKPGAKAPPPKKGKP